MEIFDAKKFIDEQVERIRRVIGGEKALIAVSGGVDSTTSAVLTYRAIGKNLICVILDDAFMREDEPERVAETLSKPPLSLPIKVVDVRREFLEVLSGIRDAEEKRKRFREQFYTVLSRIARSEGCSVLVQGTILADIIETVKEIKTQHNVLEQIGIEPKVKYGFKVVEPLASLLKWQVREVARELGVPREISERQPFPGPGLSIRVVGEVTEEKLEVLKRCTSIVESELHYLAPSQYFAAIIDDVEECNEELYKIVRREASQVLGVTEDLVLPRIYSTPVTGMIGDERRYGKMVDVKILGRDGSPVLMDIEDLIPLQARIIEAAPSLTRVVYTVSVGCEEGPYAIIVRSVETKDFLTASVSKVPRNLLLRVAGKIIKSCEKVSRVSYDITPKPPATIEME